MKWQTKPTVEDFIQGLKTSWTTASKQIKVCGHKLLTTINLHFCNISLKNCNRTLSLALIGTSHAIIFSFDFLFPSITLTAILD